jgi:creatinine amidohydrolase
LRLKEMRPPDIAAALVRDPRLIVPVGTCELHGNHLPLGAGTIIVERLSDDLSARFGVLRAPTIEYGVNAFSERESPGNASLRRKTLHRVLNDLLASWECYKVRQFILLTAHGYDPHLDALSTVMTGNSEVRVVDILSTGISDLLDGQPAPLRGDEVDTSLLLYIAPTLVDPNIQDYRMSTDEARRYRRGTIKLPKDANGVACRPSLATPEKGQRIYQRIYERIAARVFARDVAQEIAPD